ncbi:hypothetical protein BVRB_8g188510 [Beta vulgaris subsp. vulgaris]|nr:hypothetical protein BVRB_8g188510 [Beta vulgaris subsp. vulgaris]
MLLIDSPVIAFVESDSLTQNSSSRKLNGKAPEFVPKKVL